LEKTTFEEAKMRNEIKKSKINKKNYFTDKIVKGKFIFESDANCIFQKSKDEITEIVNAYNSDERIINIKTSYKIDASIQRIPSLLPDVIIEEKCQHCGSTMFKRQVYRSNGGSYSKPICSKLTEINDTTYIGCKDYLSSAKRDKYLDLMSNPLHVSELDYRDMCMLSWLSQRNNSKQLGVLMPLVEQFSMLEPVKKEALKYIKELLKHKVLVVHFDSEISSFKSKDYPNNFDLELAAYAMNIEMDFMGGMLLEELDMPFYQILVK